MKKSFSPSPARSRRHFLLSSAAALSLPGTVLGDLHWPTAELRPLRELPPELRWDATGWEGEAEITGANRGDNSPLLQRVRRELEKLALVPNTPRQLAWSAVLHRLRKNTAAAQESYDSALRAESGLTDDPDVALTGAWLSAQRQAFPEALALGARALPRMPLGEQRPPMPRVYLVCELARWSMALGPSGLPQALTWLRDIVVLFPNDLDARLLYALALARENRWDEAAHVAPRLSTQSFLRGRRTQVPVDLAAMSALAATLSNPDPALARQWLQEAISLGGPWQEFHRAMLSKLPTANTAATNLPRP